MTFRKIALAVSTTALFASFAFAQMPGFGGGPGGPGGHGGWKHKQWGDQWGQDNSPWNDKQTERLKRMTKEIAQAIDDNSDELNPMEQFEIASRLRDIKNYIDSVTPNQPPPILPPGPGPGPGPGKFDVVGQVIAAVSNNPNQQSQWIEVQLNGGLNSVDAVQLTVQQLSPSPGMKPAFVRIYEIRASQTTMGGKSVAIGNMMKTMDLFPQNQNMPIPFDLGEKRADKIWVRAEAMGAKFSLGVTVLDRKGFGGGGFPGGFPGGGIGGKPGHFGKPDGNFN